MATSTKTSRPRTTPASTGKRSNQRTRDRLARHAIAAAASAGLIGLFWQTRPNWVADMRLWKAAGDASYVLLLGALALGPLSKLVPSTRSWLRWRRPLGIWFALTATLHGVLILNGWARWSLRRFLGYEFVPQLGREVRLEPGFGLANLIGLVALFLALLLAATSSDRAMRRLGRPAWLWLHRAAQSILLLSLLHGGYYLFIHFTASFHKIPPGLDWFRVPFLVSGLTLVALQGTAFIRSAVQNGSATTTPSTP